MVLATPLLPFLPLAANQILLTNFLSDLPSIAISSDTVDPERVTQPQRCNIHEFRKFMIVFGLVSSVFDLIAFALLQWVFHADEGRWCRTLTGKDSHCESMQLDGAHEQAITHPVAHDVPVQLHCFAPQARVFADPLPGNACVHA